jgi:PHD/YefM family antitoxin component YafN of YafNO toxin-antitoxin module
LVLDPRHLEDACDSLPSLAERVARDRAPVILTRGRKKAVALVPADLLEALEDAADARDLCAAVAKAEGEPTVAWEDLKAEAARSGATPVEGFREE